MIISCLCEFGFINFFYHRLCVLTTHENDTSVFVSVKLLHRKNLQTSVVLQAGNIALVIATASPSRANAGTAPAIAITENPSSQNAPCTLAMLMYWKPKIKIPALQCTRNQPALVLLRWFRTKVSVVLTLYWELSSSLSSGISPSWWWRSTWSTGIIQMIHVY